MILGKWFQKIWRKKSFSSEQNSMILLPMTGTASKIWNFAIFVRNYPFSKLIFNPKSVFSLIFDIKFWHAQRKSRPRGHDEVAVVQKVRNHCIESLEKYNSSDEAFFMISSMHLNRFDGSRFVRELIETMKQRDTKKINYSDGKFKILRRI